MNYDKAIEAFEEKSTELARQVVRSKPTVARLQQDYRSVHYDGLVTGDPHAVAASEMHLDLVDYLRGVNSHSESIAFTMLEGFLDARKKQGDRQPTPVATAAV